MSEPTRRKFSSSRVIGSAELGFTANRVTPEQAKTVSDAARAEAERLRAIQNTEPTP